jgi:hypothetical protein
LLALLLTDLGQVCATIDSQNAMQMVAARAIALTVTKQRILRSLFMSSTKQTMKNNQWRCFTHYCEIESLAS